MRFFVQVSDNLHSSVVSVDPADRFVFDAVDAPSGSIPTVTVMAQRDLAAAYWSFLRHRHHEAARAVGARLLEIIDTADATAVASRILVAAAESTLRFVDLREREGRLGEVLAIRADELVDLRTLAWARRFDSDPAPESVFGEELDALIEMLAEEPPAHSETVRVLFHRLPTAVDIREALRDEPDETARSAVRRVWALADAMMWDRDELAFEGWSPNAPSRSSRPEAEDRKAVRSDPSPGPMSV